MVNTNGISKSRLSQRKKTQAKKSSKDGKQSENKSPKKTSKRNDNQLAEGEGIVKIMKRCYDDDVHTWLWYYVKTTNGRLGWITDSEAENNDAEMVEKFDKTWDKRPVSPITMHKSDQLAGQNVEELEGDDDEDKTVASLGKPTRAEADSDSEEGRPWDMNATDDEDEDEVEVDAEDDAAVPPPAPAAPGPSTSAPGGGGDQKPYFVRRSCARTWRIDPQVCHFPAEFPPAAAICWGRGEVEVDAGDDAAVPPPAPAAPGPSTSPPCGGGGQARSGIIEMLERQRNAQRERRAPAPTGAPQPASATSEVPEASSVVLTERDVASLSCHEPKEFNAKTDLFQLARSLALCKWDDSPLLVTLVAVESALGMPSVASMGIKKRIFACKTLRRFSDMEKDVTGAVSAPLSVRMRKLETALGITSEMGNDYFCYRIRHIEKEVLALYGR